MIWQDLVLAITNMVLGYAIIPQVYEGFKKKKGLVNLQTSFLTSLGLYIIGIVVLTLKLYFAAIIDFVIAILWTILFIQKIIYD